MSVYLRALTRGQISLDKGTDTVELGLIRFDPTPQVIAPTVVRQRSLITARRGAVLGIPAPTTTPPAFIDQGGVRPRWIAGRRRFSGVAVPAQIGPGEALPTPGITRQCGYRPKWAPSIRRGRFQPLSLPQVGPGEGPLAPTERRTALRLGAIGRRGAYQLVPLAAPTVASTVGDQSGYRPRWTPAIRRGRPLLVPPPQIGPGEGPLAPCVQRLWQRPGILARRGAFPPLALLAPAVALTVTAQPGSRPKWTPAVRRGRIFAPPPLPPAAGGPLVGSAARATRRYAGLPFRRGLLRPRPWFESAAPQASVASEVALARRAVAIYPRRGRFMSLVGITLPVTIAGRRLRVFSLPVRRGAYLPVPAPALGYSPVAPSWHAPTGRRFAITAHRGSFLAVPVIAALIPTRVRRVGGALAAPSRRGTYLLLPLGALGVAPLVPSGSRPARRYNGAPVRHGALRPRPWFEPPTSAPLAPTVAHETGFRPRWFPLPRRAQFSSALLIVLAPPLPAALPLPPHGRVAKVGSARRGAFQATPLAPQTVPAAAFRHDRGPSGMRRGRVIPLPLAALGYAPVVPGRITTARRLPGLPARRVTFQPLPVAPAVTPFMARISPRPTATASRRGLIRPRPWLPPPGVAPLAPSLIRQLGAVPKWGPLPRRGQFSSALLVGLAPALPPAPPTQIRGHAARLAAGRRGAVQPLPTWPLAIATITRRRSVAVGLPARHGTLQAVPAFPSRIPPLTRQSPRVASPVLRRGIAWTRPWLVPSGPATLVPPFIRQCGPSPKWGPVPRRGQVSSALLVGLAPPPPTPLPRLISGTRSRTGVIRRGVLLPGLPAPRIASLAQAVTRARRALAPTARHRAFLAVVATAPVAARANARLRLAAAPRRGYFLPVPAVTPSLARLVARTGSIRAATVRRGRIGTPVTAGRPATCPAWYRCTSRTVTVSRRGRFAALVPLPPAGPGALCPSISRATRRYAGLPFRRGRWIQGVVPPQVFFAAPSASAVGSTTPIAVAGPGVTSLSIAFTPGQHAFPGPRAFPGAWSQPVAGPAQ